MSSLSRMIMGLQAISSAVLQTCKRPWACARTLWDLQHVPSENLRTIASVADKTIRDAALQGIKMPSRAGEVDEELSGFLQSSEPLPGRVNHEERQKELRKTLTNKVSVFTALLQMRNRAGIQETNNLKILGLVQQATESRAPVSLWDLFTSQYELSWFQTLSAAFFYWFYYQTSLIDNTVSAYLEAFFRNFTKGLNEESNETRTKVFRAFIEEVNEFLTEDIKATRAYAYGETPGSLAKIQDHSIEQVYGGLLSKLCEDFSQSQVMGASPQVKFLEDFQNIPVIGHAVKAFEWAINRYIIQSTMMYSILPQSLETGVTKGLSMTHVDNLPFVISLTQFFTSQLENLRTELDSEKSSSEPSHESVPGTELLPPTIKLLLQALELEGPYTPLELRKKFEQHEKGQMGGLLNVAQRMETATTDSANMLFSYLHRSIQSGELITRLLELSLNPFSGQTKTEAMLRAEHREELSKFFRTSETVFRKLIRTAISPSNYADVRYKSIAAHKVLEHQKTVATWFVQKIGALCDQIGQKIEASQGRVAPEYDIQKDLVSLSQFMQILESRHEFRDPLEFLDSTHRDEIWRLFNGLFSKIAALQEQQTKLRTQSLDHLKQAAIVRQLEAIQTTLLTFRGHEHPLIETLQTPTTELVQLFGPQDPSALHLQNTVHAALETSHRLHLENSALESLKALYFQADAHSAPTGLLVQLFNTAQGISLFGLTRKKILSQIAQHLTHVPAEEEALTTLIGDGSQITARWNEIGSTLYNSYRAHIEAKESLHNRLQSHLASLQQWTDTQENTYTKKTRESYQAMRDSMQLLASFKTDLVKDAGNLPSSLTTPLSPMIWNSASLAIPVPAVMSLGGPIALGASLSAAAWRYLNPATPSTDSFTRSLVKKCATVGSVALAALYAPGLAAAYLPAQIATAAAWTAPAAAAAVAGQSLIDVGKQGTETIFFEQVWDKFTQAYNLTLNQRVYKAFFTRFLKRTTQA